MKLKRNTVSFLALLLLLSTILTSCVVVLPKEEGGDTPPETSGPPSVDTDDKTPPGTQIRPSVDYNALAEENLSVLPSYDMKEAGFLILTSRKDLITPVVEQDEQEGRRVDLATLRRNQAVEEKYNVLLVCIEMDESELHSSIQQSVNSSLYLADLIELPYLLLGDVASDNLTVNLNSLPFTDYTQSYFNQTAIAQCSAGYTTYGVVGNANAHDRETYCLYFRADLLKKSPAELYQMAYGGTWTWDTLLTLASQAESTTATLALSQECNLAQLLLATGNTHLLQTGYGKLPEADPDFTAVQTAVELTTRLLPLSSKSLTAEDFKNGNSLFYLGTVAEHGEFATLSAPWGILPLPKNSASQENYATLGAYQTVFTAIRTMSSPERTGLILQALNAASVGQTTEALIKDALLKSAQSADAANMIALFAGRCSYDFGYMMKSGYSSVRRASVTAYETAITENKLFSELYRDQEDNLIYWNPKNFVWN